MVKIANLEIEQWSRLLSHNQDINQVAARCLNGRQCPWVKTLLSEIKDCKTVLDLGCGNGETPATLALQGKRVAMMDWSMVNLNFSKLLFKAVGKKAKFIHSDMTKPLPLEDNSYDVVFSCGVFEYFEDDQIVAVLKECFRVARKRVIIMVPNAASVVYRIGKKHLELTGKWYWGGERPFWSLKQYFKHYTTQMREYSVGTKHSLDFLKMKGGKIMARWITRIFRLRDKSQPTRFNQGYLLFTIGEKE